MCRHGCGRSYACLQFMYSVFDDPSTETFPISRRESSDCFSEVLFYTCNHVFVFPRCVYPVIPLVLLQFWDFAMRFPPALEAFDQHGGVSKLLYLLLPTTSQVRAEMLVLGKYYAGVRIRVRAGRMDER